MRRKGFREVCHEAGEATHHTQAKDPSVLLQLALWPWQYWLAESSVAHSSTSVQFVPLTDPGSELYPV